jgi:hypothetical protein
LPKYKVLLETTVLIAASVYAARQELPEGKLLKHQFYDRSMKLIGFLRKYLAHEIGITTQTTSKDAWKHLEKGIRDSLGPDVELKSVAQNICENQLDDLMRDFPEEPVDLPKVSEKYSLVVATYKELEQRAFLVDHGTATAAIADKLENLIPILRRPRGHKVQRKIDRFRQLKVEIEARQLLRDRSQLRRMRDPNLRPDGVDMTVVAEAAFLYDKFNALQETRVFLASTDKCMSPNLDDNGNVVSNNLTAAIENNFHVCCDWPERITETLKPFYP